MPKRRMTPCRSGMLLRLQPTTQPSMLPTQQPTLNPTTVEQFATNQAPLGSDLPSRLCIDTDGDSEAHFSLCSSQPTLLPTKTPTSSPTLSPTSVGTEVLTRTLRGQ
jgi:hypothetical protein